MKFVNGLVVNEANVLHYLAHLWEKRRHTIPVSSLIRLFCFMLLGEILVQSKDSCCKFVKFSSNHDVRCRLYVQSYDNSVLTEWLPVPVQVSCGIVD